jgi:hypothetical protein
MGVLTERSVADQEADTRSSTGFATPDRVDADIRVGRKEPCRTAPGSEASAFASDLCVLEFESANDVHALMGLVVNLGQTGKAALEALSFL